MPPMKPSYILSRLSHSLRTALGGSTAHAATTPSQAAAAAVGAAKQPHHQTRWAHTTNEKEASKKPNVSFPPSKIPRPIPLVPDVATFLKVIGRGLSQHAAKIPTWEALFTLTSDQFRELGIEPARTRRYLIEWRQKYREGRFGVGADLRYVRDGVADLRVLEVVKGQLGLNKRRVVVNVPPGSAPDGDLDSLPPGSAARVKGYKVVGVRDISGPYALPIKGRAGARLTVTEGMWEDKRGRKIDGGERRRDEIRFKRRVAERRAFREAGGFI